MKKIRKIIILTFLIFLVFTAFSCAFAVYDSQYDKITVYSYYGSKEIYYFELDSYLEQGWSISPVKLDNVTPLPTTFWKTNGYSSYALDLNEFYVESFESLSSYGEIRINYYMDYEESGSIDLVVKCFNSNGDLIKKVNLDKNSDYFDVPDTTATFSIVPVADYRTNVSGEFYYCRQVDLYAPDGRILTVYDVQAPLYEKYGWQKAVLMLSRDGRVIEVPPYKVKEYESVGWYTVEKFGYEYITDVVNECIADGEYELAIEYVENEEEFFAGTEYEGPVRLLKERAMDLWRNKTRCPLGYIDHRTGKEYGVPYAEIAVRNISYKPIIAFKVDFTCYDVFGDVEYTEYDGYTCTDVEIGSCEGGVITWDLDGAYNVHRIGDFRVFEVVFADGTKWKR